jgi:UDP-N-acetyl-D-glucosamine dehydrogenase
VRCDVAVFGLGYVGLSLARAVAASGQRVVGYEVQPTVVDALSAGRSHVDDVSDEDLRAMAAAGFVATCEAAELGEVDTVVICAPTPLGADGTPDLAPVRQASWTIAKLLRPSMLVVLESTSYPGTTDDVVRPILEQGSGLRAGADFHLAFSPERIDPGNARFGLASTPKVVGGVTAACTAAAASFYRRFVGEVVQARGTREAELAKIIENTYRHVNIAMVNEMARLAGDLDVDLWNAIDCAATKPFGFQPFYPGPGPGGHCIPVDPNYLTYKVRAEGSVLRIVELAQEINSGMPRYVVERAVRALNRRSKAVNGSKVLLLGVTYKPNIADLRGTPSADIAARLRELGADLSYHDPYVPLWTIEDVLVPRTTNLSAALADADLTILVQDHTVYDPAELIKDCQLLLDTRGLTRGSRHDNIEIL